MAFTSSVVLPDDMDGAKKEYTRLVGEDDLGLATVLGSDCQSAFNHLRVDSSDPQMRVTSVWAKTEQAISGVKAVLDTLENGEKVLYGPNGHRVVSVNRKDRVSFALDKAGSDDSLKLDRAFNCASRVRICGF
jgi:hypothetical protein